MHISTAIRLAAIARILLVGLTLGVGLGAATAAVLVGGPALIASAAVAAVYTLILGEIVYRWANRGRGRDVARWRARHCDLTALVDAVTRPRPAGVRDGVDVPTTAVRATGSTR